MIKLNTGDKIDARADWKLEDRFLATAGEGLLTGLQAVARSPLDQRRRDQARGLETAAYVSGYPGSPLAGLDLELGRQRALLEEVGVLHRPGLNEELAATAVQGTQLIEKAGARYQGVTGYWYGKAPGLDRALDAIRHGNLMGTHPQGGVVAFVGDDGAAKSSSLPSASERVLRSAFVPVLAPADVQDVLDFGAHAVALSRAAGTWVAVKLATNVVDGNGSVDLDLDRLQLVPVDPGSFSLRRRPPSGDLSPPITVGLERSLLEQRLPLAAEYGRLNGLNRIVRRGPGDRLGIAASGRTYPELRQSLADLGLSEAELEQLGIRLLKVGMPWPLDGGTIREFAAGLEHVLVVEDKGPFLRTLMQEALYGVADAPRFLGDGLDGEAGLPQHGELDADRITTVLAPWVLGRLDHGPARERLRLLERSVAPSLQLPVLASRAPYFCSGCPHSTSTQVPDGTLVGGGIGCHGMVAMMDPERVGELLSMTQMGGEGAQWLGMAPFVERRHIVQNIGDGTFAHSGSLAVRAAVADGANITYKLLYNSAVAMTGGQPAVGAGDVAAISRELEAEGVEAIIVTTEDRGRYRGVELAPIAELWPRERIVAAQEKLAAVDGVTVLIHDQECAAELRRKRKRGKAPLAERRVFIDSRVCEGCGDCGAKSNCLSLVPAKTEFGTKTEVDQTSCNSDYSCLQGDCPSFATISLPESSSRPSSNRRLPAPLDPKRLSAPPVRAEDAGAAVRLCGIGGTGVVTVAQVLATAAFLDGYEVRGLDQTGLAQKAGPVVSDLRLDRFGAGSNKIGAGECSLLLGCDPIVASEARNLTVASPERTTAVVSTAEVPTGEIVSHPGLEFPPLEPMVARIAERSQGEPVLLDAEAIAERALGSAQFANMVLAGAGYQTGALPLGWTAIERAIELNGVAVEANRQALLRGRQAVADPAGLAADLADPAAAPTAAASGSELERLLEIRVPELTTYQSPRYAQRYADAVRRVAAAERAAVPGHQDLAEAVARSLYKLMAYKDEYEVARLLSGPEARQRVEAQFGPDAEVTLHLHPPALRALGMERKIELGRHAAKALRLLPPLRRLRGTVLDPFGRAAVRKLERRLPGDYLEAVERLLPGLRPGNHQLAVRIAELPDAVRGYEQVKVDSAACYEDQLAALLTEFDRGQTDSEDQRHKGVTHA